MKRPLKRADRRKFSTIKIFDEYIYDRRTNT
jgi:hypothetical protein